VSDGRKVCILDTHVQVQRDGWSGDRDYEFHSSPTSFDSTTGH
jgi:hypothetical protein